MNSIMYENGGRYVGDVQNGKRHGIGMMQYISGGCIVGVWEDDVFSPKLTFWRSDNSLLRIDHTIWETFDQTSLTGKQKEDIVEGLEEELQVRVGERVGEKMTDTQLSEFDEIESTEEATKWLNEHMPGYGKDVFMAYSEFKDEIIRDWLNRTGNYIPRNDGEEEF